MSDALRRATRTLMQLLAGGGFTWLFDQLANDLPTSYVPYVMGLATVLVAMAQNALEDAGKIPALLKAPASDGANPVPEDGGGQPPQNLGNPGPFHKAQG